MASKTFDKSNNRRRWRFRFLAVAFALLPFALIEMTLIAFDVGSNDPNEDPFVGFADVVPLFELDQKREQFVVSSRRKKFFAHDEFPKEKATNTFRIFCLGGSTVQGRPYSIETSFTSWLKIGLTEADSETNWEVINCGGISYASYRLVPILEEVLHYHPDLIILCTGHNEFLEDRSYNHLKQMPSWVEQPVSALNSSRTVRLTANLFRSQQGQKPILQTDADAMLDYKNGIAAYHRDEDWHHSVATHFEMNVLRMIQIAQSNDIPILLLKPPSNLSGTAPFKSESFILSHSKLAEIERMKSEARSLYATDLHQATDHWKKICDIDSGFATNWYEYGSCLLVQQKFSEAKLAFIKARDLDICPLRMTSPLESVLEQLSKEVNVPLMDIQKLFEVNTSTGIVGQNWLVDHVHPNFEGHQKIAIAIARWCEGSEFVEIGTSWENDCQKRFAEHFETLPRTYFHRGQRMLSALKKWTQGDADGAPVEERFPHKFTK